MLVRHPTNGSTLNIARLKMGEMGGLSVVPSTDTAILLASFERGIQVDWELDPVTRRPVAIRLSPATDSNGAYLKTYGAKPHLWLATRKLFGRCTENRAQYVEEIIAQDHISIPIPYTFRRSRRRSRRS